MKTLRFVVTFTVFVFSCNAYADYRYYSQLFTYVNFKNIDFNKSTIVFLHGSPGDHKAFEKYYTDPALDSFFNLISIDRPTFGRSTDFPFKDQPTMQEQASVISETLKDILQKSPVLLVGHSYGAPLAALIANSKNINVKGLVLISGAFSPHNSTLRWYNKVAKHPFIQWALPQSIKAANHEMLSLDQSIKAHFPELLKTIEAPMLFIHGSGDKIVDVGHSTWAHEIRRNNRKKTKLYQLDSGHFALWSRAQDIKKLILTHYSSQRPSSSQK